MIRLWPDPGAEFSPAELVRELRPWEDPPADRPRVLSNFAISLDGRATLGGTSGRIAGAIDTELLVALRTRVDAVLIGAGTMRAERYGRVITDSAKREARERLSLPHDPLLVLVSDSMDLPWDAGAFTNPGRVLIFTNSPGEAPETTATVRVQRSEGPIELGRVLTYLRQERGIRALLCEGGPHLHGQLHMGGLVDEMFVTVAPRLVGGEGPGMVAGLPESDRRLELSWLVFDPETGDQLGRYVVARGE